MKSAKIFLADTDFFYFLNIFLHFPSSKGLELRLWIAVSNPVALRTSLIIITDRERRGVKVETF